MDRYFRFTYLCDDILLSVSIYFYNCTMEGEKQRVNLFYLRPHNLTIMTLHSTRHCIRSQFFY